MRGGITISQLAQIQQASESEKNWTVTNLILQNVQPDLREAIQAAAVPHWFNPRILAALLSVHKTEAINLYEKMKVFIFTEKFGILGHTIHGVTRDAILWNLVNHQLNRLQNYSNYAWTYFSQFDDDAQSAVEATYHLLIANSQIGLKRFKNQLASYEQQYNFSAVNNLINDHKELIKLRLLPNSLPEFNIGKPSSIEKSKMCILHLSDLHLENKVQARVYRTQLETDLIRELKIKRLEYLVISGDIANRATEDEYNAAFEMLDGLIKSFNLSPECVVIVPGNHDLCWDASRKAYAFSYQDDLPKPLPQDKCIPAGDTGMLLRDERLYQQRFANQWC
jgi:hypothetical protein